MREKRRDVAIMIFAVVLVIAMTLPGMPTHFTNIQQFGPIETVSGGGVIVDGDRLLIDINTADAELLMELDGVGDAIAQRIIDYREENGPFACVEDLVAVKGIGPATLEKLRPYVGVE